MKKILSIIGLLFFFFVHGTLANVITVFSIKGHVEVRRGVSEEWKTLIVGDVLRPEDTIRTGEDAQVKIQISEKDFFLLNSFSMIDISDIRQITKSDLLLKLSMEYIRNLPNSKPNSVTPSTTIMHGDDKSLGKSKEASKQKEIAGEVGTMRFEGAKTLFQHRYYSSAILAIKSTIRKFGMRDQFNAHQLIAQSFERLGLIQHAIDEYASCSQIDLTDAQKKEVNQQIARLKEINR